MIMVKFRDAECQMAENLLRSLIESNKLNGKIENWDTELLTCKGALESIHVAHAERNRYLRYKVH